VLLYPEGLLILNPTSEAIVRLCDGERTLGQIIDALAARYGTSPAALGGDVTEHVERLQSRNLVELQSEGGGS
jgi:pyrroloquinoline quinone biosynthesis protein D